VEELIIFSPSVPELSPGIFPAYMCGKVIIRAYNTTAERSDKLLQNATVSIFAKPGLPNTGKSEP
jgi:hypothetical protein